MDFDFLSPVIESSSKAFDYVWGGVKTGATYLDEHQWAADAVKGAAVGGAGYLMQKDQQQHEEKLADKRYKREVDLKLQYSQAPVLGGDSLNVGAGLLNAGAALQADDSLIQRKRTV